MLKVEIVAIGKLSQKFLQDGCKEYEKRIAPYWQLTVSELSEQKLLKNGAAEERRVVEAEGERILKRLSKKKDPVIALAVEGKGMPSEKMAEYLLGVTKEHSGVTFVIGGSMGLSDAVKRRADVLLSVSRMTFTHQFARLILLEQLYRAAAINAGISYHK